jgi:hypothetical protein
MTIVVAFGSVVLALPIAVLASRMLLTRAVGVIVVDLFWTPASSFSGIVTCEGGAHERRCSEEDRCFGDVGNVLLMLVIKHGREMLSAWLVKSALKLDALAGEGTAFGCEAG